MNQVNPHTNHDNPNWVHGQTGMWEVVIGLEVHAQITSKSKLFSGASTHFGADPNTQVDFLDAGMPGMLPVLNAECVNQGIRTGLGLNGTVHFLSVFDRKNYFYADLPTGYQISQFTKPIMTQGYLDIDIDGKTKRIAITRLHLEQDAGKSIHDLSPDSSYIDLNRAGIGLMEIVSEPDIRSPQEAMAYVKKLRSILRYLGSCDGNMEEGSLRVDANVSLHRPGTPFGTRAEIKNVNSIRFLGQAITYEINRQLDILEEGGTIIQETRLFDPTKGETRAMRSKEDAHDYRYFPDPDLPPLRLSRERIECLRATLPELPDQKKNRFVELLGLSSYDADVLVSEREIADYYESALSHLNHPAEGAKILANWLISEVFGLMNKTGKTLSSLPFPAAYLAELVDLIVDGTLSGKMGKTLFSSLWETGKSPNLLVLELGLSQVSDSDTLKRIAQEVLDANPDQVLSYKDGKTQLFGFFVGQVMKKLKGQGNPTLINETLHFLLD